MTRKKSTRNSKKNDDVVENDATANEDVVEENETPENNEEAVSDKTEETKKDAEVAAEAEATEPPANDDIEHTRQPKQFAHAAKPLALKMARVMAEVSTVPKNGRNDFHGYDYIMESDLVDQLRGKLAAQGVAIFPSIREHVVSQVQDARGRAQYMATVTLDVTFIDGDSGDQMTTTWVGQGVDAGDKSYYKAYTGAFKYALLKTFLIAGEDDGNPEVRAPRQSSSRRRAGGRR
jgi:hypothetical protein